MEKLRLTVRFATPAFLGNASQQGQWRTPPFKAQLRQWWRVVHGASQNYRVNVPEMLRLEGELFGTAGANDAGKGASKSKLRLRLSDWRAGSLRKGDWPYESGKVQAPAGHQVGPHAYLGFGPLMGGRSTKLENMDNALDAGASAELALGVPAEYAQEIRQALWLMDRFGTVGGRSRNGWGSYSLAGEDVTLEKVEVLRDWREALELDWPHALGTDEQGVLAWQTPARSGWQQVMKDLAGFKLGFRALFPLPKSKLEIRPSDRHWLSYPLVQPHVRDWKSNNLRLPNSLRFKVVPAEAGQWQGRIFHVPCQPPAGFQPDLNAITRVWSGVHQWLDAHNDLQRLDRGGL